MRAHACAHLTHESLSVRLCLRGLTTRNCSYTCSTDATAHATAHATPPTTVVVVGGLVDEGSGVDDVVGCFGVCAPTKFYGRHLDTAWTGVKDLTHAISEQGIIAIMIGLPDGDEQQYACLLYTSPSPRDS